MVKSEGWAGACKLRPKIFHFDPGRQQMAQTTSAASPAAVTVTTPSRVTKYAVVTAATQPLTIATTATGPCRARRRRGPRAWLLAPVG